MSPPAIAIQLITAITTVLLFRILICLSW